MRCRGLIAIAVSATTCLGGATRAQDQYPSRLITLIAPITAGTAIDILARLYADKLAKQFGQQVVVANRAGAGGLIGAQAVANSAADGTRCCSPIPGTPSSARSTRTCRSIRLPILPA